MQQSPTQAGSQVDPEENLISLLDIVYFLKDEWKRIGIAAIIGAIIGATGWGMLSTYKAEAVLTNNGTLTFISWRGLEKNLPLLAGHLLETNRVNTADIEQYRHMANAKWWLKNVTPTYSLTKADTKDLANISKDLQESGGTNILNLVVTAAGSSKATAESNVEIATRFIKHGAAYLSIKNLISGYESQVLSSDSDLQRKILDAEVELKFMRDRAKNLETLRTRFPANAIVGNQQIVDLKDSNAKFMPISTQIVAVNSDINNTTESLQRMQDQLSQLNTLRAFVSESQPLLEKHTDGLALADALLEIENRMRKALSPADVNGLQTLNNIQATLVGMRTGFSKSLDNNLAPMVSRVGPAMPMLTGLFAGAVFVIILALGKRVYVRIQSQLTSVS